MTASNSISATSARRTGWRPQIFWLAILAWTVLVAVAIAWLLKNSHSPSVFVVRDADPKRPPGVEELRGWFKNGFGLQRAYPWLLFGPYVGLLAFCFPLERGRLCRNAILNLLGCIGFVAGAHALNAQTRFTQARVMIFRTASRSVDGGIRQVFSSVGSNVLYSETSNLPPHMPPDFEAPPPFPKMPGKDIWSDLLDLLAYGAIAGISHSIYFYRRYREREHRTLLLESSLGRARLEALRAQLQPHFLFNSLNAIATLLRRDPKSAEAMLLALSDLLRLALNQSTVQEVRLRDELLFIERYLEIQQMRFGAKLRSQFQLAPETLDCAVPALLLQPLVENAIRHGLEPADHGGCVCISALRENEKLVVTVSDNGVGLRDSDNASAGQGIGLANLRERLTELYREHQSLTLTNLSEGGVSVRVELPWRPLLQDEKQLSSPVS